MNQKIKPKYIIINYCSNYKRLKNVNYNLFNEKILYFENKYTGKFIFNKSDDYGPITKALGLINLPENIKKI